jgi:hypothetical protein
LAEKKALAAVVQKAHVRALSTRSIDVLVQGGGITGIDAIAAYQHMGARSN